MSLAVGMIIGGAFAGVVASLTDNILSPIIGLVTGGNFDALELHFLGVTLRYGAFITSVINFIILAFVVFFLVRAMNRLLAKEEQKAEEASKRLCPFCKTQIDPEATRCPACTSQLGGTE